MTEMGQVPTSLSNENGLGGLTPVNGPMIPAPVDEEVFQKQFQHWDRPPSRQKEPNMA